MLEHIKNFQSVVCAVYSGGCTLLGVEDVYNLAVGDFSCGFVVVRGNLDEFVPDLALVERVYVDFDNEDEVDIEIGVVG